MINGASLTNGTPNAASQFTIGGLPLPQEMREMVADGTWPVDEAPASKGYRFDLQKVKLLVPHASELHLIPAPFLNRICTQLDPCMVRRSFRRPPPEPPEASRYRGKLIVKRRLLRYEEFMLAFWNWPCAAPQELDFTLAIDIGDFGPGTDAPIVLDYRINRLEPRVMYLKQKWTEKGEPDNHWCEAAPSFRDFARQIGLARA